jgi:hypothetical protein
MTFPEKFPSIIQDFVQDLSNTFPEYSYLWAKWTKEVPETEWQYLYEYSLSVYPELFFDLLYENEDMFSLESKNTLFLPNVEFKLLYNSEGVSDITRKSIWKYIQLILFTIVGNLKDKEEFGKSMDLFEGIDEKELQEKLTSTISGIGDFFKNLEKTEAEPKKSEPELNQFFDKMFGDMGGMKGMQDFEKFPEFAKESPKESKSQSKESPDPEDIHNHLKDLFGGKLGGLAKELAEELSEELKDGLGLGPDMDSGDLFKNLMKHPDKFMTIVKKINQKFQEKMKRGDISKEELMKEATEMLKKMKEMGGNSKEMTEMFQKMASSMGGFQNPNPNPGNPGTGKKSTKERMRANLEKKLVYLPPGAEVQERSLIQKPYVEKDLDTLVAEIEAVGKGGKVGGKKKRKN